MQIIRRGRITKPEQDVRFNSITFPCIVKTSSGRWLAAYKASEKKGDCDFQHAVISWSDDEGITWSQPSEPVHLPDIAGVPGQSRIAYLLPLEDDRILMLLNWVDSSDTSQPYYDPVHESLKDTRIFYCFSEDDGESWSVPVMMNTEPVNDPVPLTGPPMKLRDGTIICQFEINKAVHDPAKWVHRSALIFSYDNGQTWRDVTIVTSKPGMYYWDQRPAVLIDDFSMVDFFWTLDGAKNQYLNIHRSESMDGGKSWNEPEDTGIYGQPGNPVVLDDGKLVCIDIDRSQHPVVTVRTSRNSGKTFDRTLVVFEKDIKRQDSRNISMNEAWDEMYRFTTGHPNLLNLGNGEVLAYYYTGDQCDDTHIEFVKIDVS